MLVIYGGSFNPPTLAHLEVVKKIKSKFNQARIIIMPTSCKNYTWKDNLASDKDRIKMLELMFKGIEISNYEMTHEKYMGTYQMLSEFKEIDSDIYFVLGSDNLVQMPLWKNALNLAKDFKFILLKRPTDAIDFGPFEQYKDNFSIVEMNSEINATAIRDDVLGHREWLDQAVFEYIVKNKIYEVTNA